MVRAPVNGSNGLITINGFSRISAYSVMFDYGISAYVFMFGEAIFRGFYAATC